MMKEIDLPFELILHGVTYQMRARGFWWGKHYWCKVVRTVGGLSGVWYHNDAQNEGIATIVSRELSSIGGAAEHTSWVMYSRAPTAEEASIIDKSNIKMNHAYGDRFEGDLPFSQVAIEDKDKLEDLEDWFDNNSDEDQLQKANPAKKGKHVRKKVDLDEIHSDEDLPEDVNTAKPQKGAKQVRKKLQFDEIHSDKDQSEDVNTAKRKKRQIKGRRILNRMKSTLREKTSLKRLIQHSVKKRRNKCGRSPIVMKWN